MQSELIRMTSQSKPTERQRRAGDGLAAAALAELTNQALAGDDLPALMQQAVDCVVRALGVQHSAIWALAPGGDALVLRAGTVWQGDTAGTSVELANAPALRSVLLGSAGRFVADWRDGAQPEQPALLREHGVVTSLFVASAAPGCPHSVLSADSTVVQSWSERDIDFLQALANIVALAAERRAASETFEQRARERTLRIERRRRVAQSLHEILTILNSSHTLDGLLAYLIAQACRLLGAAAGAIYRLHGASAQLSVQASWGLNSVDAAPDLPLDSSAPGEAVRLRMPVRFTERSAAAAAVGPNLVPDGGAAPDYAALAVPLVVKGDVYGAIALYDDRRSAFSDEDIVLAATLSDHAALAIENARLVASAQDKAVLEERQRLARDLHDSVTQALYGVTLHAQAARRLLEASHVATAADSLRALQDTAQEALDEMRLLIFELRPTILDQAGLVAALQARLEAVEGRAKLQTKLLADQLGVLPAAVEHALYRIAQEALNNALKHARAGSISVELRRTPTDVILEISDDGIGFDPGSETGGLGLRGIRERVAYFKGRLCVQSAPGAGTRLRVEIAA